MRKSLDMGCLDKNYDHLLRNVIELLEEARRTSARSVNNIMTATYWEIGRRIVELEQGGAKRAEYGKSLLKKLSIDLTAKFGRGFSRQNLQQMRNFYIAYPAVEICQKPSGKLFEMEKLFPLPWSHYVRLLSVKNLEARKFYESEAFLLELGTDFAFVGRQKRLRIDDSWYRVDLVFFHRRLRCLVLIDLKLGRFTHADSGQMHVYLNYAKENWTHPDENQPIGIIICAEKGHDLAKYALEGLPNKVVASEYQTILPDEKMLVDEISKTRRILENRKK